MVSEKNIESRPKSGGESCSKSTIEQQPFSQLTCVI